MNLYNKLEERLKTKSEENDTQAPAIEVPAIEEKRIKCPKCGNTLFKKGGKSGKLICEKPDCGYERDV